jgi:hypothetical protein
MVAMLLQSVKRSRREAEERREREQLSGAQLTMTTAALHGARRLVSSVVHRTVPRTWLAFNSALLEVAAAHSATVGLYAVYHLGSLMFVLGASVLAVLLPGLSVLSMHVVLPLASTYGFCCFFTDNPLQSTRVQRIRGSEEGNNNSTIAPASSNSNPALDFSPSRIRARLVAVSPRTVFLVLTIAKALVTVLIQKSIGDLLGYLAYELGKVILLGAAGAVAVKLAYFSSRQQQQQQLHQDAAAARTVNADPK